MYVELYYVVLGKNILDYATCMKLVEDTMDKVYESDECLVDACKEFDKENGGFIR